MKIFDLVLLYQGETVLDAKDVGMEIYPFDSISDVEKVRSSRIFFIIQRKLLDIKMLKNGSRTHIILWSVQKIYKFSKFCI